MALPRLAHATNRRFSSHRGTSPSHGPSPGAAPRPFSDVIAYDALLSVGKSTLAQNLGQRALETGKSVCFSTVNAALADLLKQESLPAVERRMKRYTTPDVLLLDELGYLPCDARSGDLLYSIVSRRHERASTIITTNLAFKEWGTVRSSTPRESSLA